MPVSRTLNKEIAKGSQLHQKLVNRITSRHRIAEKGQQRRHAIWQKAEEATLAFVPETDVDVARRSARDRGEPKYTTIQIPYSYALLMSAHTYWTSVFFARSPIHQFSGRHGEGDMQVQAMEALIGYQIEVGSATAPYYVWLYDTGKYGCGILGHYWDKEKLNYGQIVEMDDGQGNVQLMQVTQELTGYQGNRCYNVSPWDFMHDPRFALKNFQQGEFCFVRRRMARADVIRRKDAGYFNENTAYLKDHTGDKGATQGTTALERPFFDSFFTEGLDEKDKYAAGNVFWEVYVELVPAEWGVGQTTFPQKWCFTITEDLGLIVGASPLGYMHCKFPFDILECEVEGYGVYARGMPQTIEPIQNTIDWLFNTHFFNVRAALNNQFIVDPSKLVIKDVQNSGPGFIWRLRPEAYGTDISKMFAQVQVSDVTRSHLQDVQAMLGVGERTLGVNDQIMGNIQNGANRKTATEIRTSTGFGVNRLKTVAEYMSAMGFAPHAQKLVQTSQQCYDATAKLRRVGSFALDAGDRFINVSPDDIAGFFDLVPVDGTLPVDRMAQANLWKEILIGTRNMPPQIVQGYDWMRIFAWSAQLAGLKNINNFKVQAPGMPGVGGMPMNMQVVPDQQLADQAQRGNVIPMPGRQIPALAPPGGPSGVEPGNSASTAAGLNSLLGEGGA